MAHRRFVHLIALVACGLGVLVLRLFQVQVLEHEVWANEAANLVRSGRVVPFRRGRITDVHGRVLARDQELYRVDLVYRDFRRGHPLGQVAHARGTLEMRAVPLAEALAHLEAWAVELVRLSPAALERWADGEALATATLALPPSAEPAREHRRSRARDLGFYAGRLLELSREEGRRMHKTLAEDDVESSWVALVAGWRGRSAADLERELRLRLGRARADLVGLAGLLPRGRATVGVPLDALIADLEECRRRVENGTAGRLFREAAGFRAGRLAPDLVGDAIDLDWIRVRLRWDDARVRAWLDAARADWTGWRDSWFVEAVAAELAAAPPGAARAEALVDQVAALYRAPGAGDERSWRAPGPRRALSSLGRLFEGAAADEGELAPGAVLPFEDPALRAFVAEPDAPWDLLGALEAWGGPSGRSELAARGERKRVGELWRAAVEPRVSTERLAGRIGPLLARCEARFEDALRDALGLLWTRARDGGRLSEAGRLAFREERLDRATERAAYIRRDLGSRPQRIAENPDYEVVHLLERYPERFAGFAARAAHVRVHDAVDARGRPVAADLVGRVRQSGVRELRAQREEAEELRGLLALGTRSRSEDDRLEELVRSVYRPEQSRGAEGLEALLDPELTGHNGYEERRGLQDASDRAFRERHWSVRPIHGQDARLTLDLDLVRAARACLEDPAWDPDPAYDDPEWRAHPVGAIVLCTTDGDVLAAASTPLEPPAVPPLEDDWVGGRPPQWSLVLERTLRKPDFQPPGSVFKPIVAAWAVENGRWDPAAEHVCEASPEAGGHAGYKNLRCWLRSGHGALDLRGALVGSCNAYFARMGEELSSADFGALLWEFGFGQPTGVNDLGDGERDGGLYEEEYARVLRLDLRTERQHLQAGNGLAVIEANPMQVARAFCALATGELPRMRLVDRVGERTVPRASRPVAVSPAVLDRVRAALRAVTSEPGGTAWKCFRELDFAVAAKTGSADLFARQTDAEGRPVAGRKHTWFAGWFPPEAPRAVLVVFVHDTRVTSSHSAVWIARQFLERPEVTAWRAAEGLR